MTRVRFATAVDFNDWSTLVGSSLAHAGLKSLDQNWAPRGPVWERMSDHLPLIGELVMLQAEG